jgi:hypothetical protein
MAQIQQKPDSRKFAVNCTSALSTCNSRGTTLSERIASLRVWRSASVIPFRRERRERRWAVAMTLLPQAENPLVL